jgi:Calcineurin-like phosphoesterase
MPSSRQVLGFVISFVTIVYLLLYIRNGLSRSLLGDVPGRRVQHFTRIVAVGDLHGDIGNAQKVLEMARVVDSDGMWSGEVDFFVQTGDIIDRCVSRRDKHLDC